MCTSRLHLVLEAPAGGRVVVENADGRRHEVSLLALEGDPPRPGEWLVVHSGYALERADATQAAEIVAELRRAAGDVA